jgi:hypothetical protein
MVTAWKGLTGFFGATGFVSGSGFPKSSFARFKTSIDTNSTPNLPTPGA